MRKNIWSSRYIEIQMSGMRTYILVEWVLRNGGGILNEPRK